MIQIAEFTYSPFYENTYVLHTPNGDCIIIDPGCYYEFEQQELRSFINDMALKPKMLINTHGHIDHIFGNKFICDTYKLLPHAHKESIPYFERAVEYGSMFGVKCERSPLPEKYLSEGDVVSLGDSQLNVLYTPGHSTDSISLYCEAQKFVIGGDVLFKESIGRTDLPGGDFNTLIRSIRTKFFTLPGEVRVYSGHGPVTSIGYEMAHNSFLND